MTAEHPERSTNPGAREVCGWYSAALPAGNTLSVLVAPLHDFLVCGYLACASRPFLSTSRVCVGVDVVTRDDAWCPCAFEPVWLDGTCVCRVGQAIVADVRNDGPDAAWFLFSVLGRTIYKPGTEAELAFLAFDRALVAAREDREKAERGELARPLASASAAAVAGFSGELLPPMSGSELAAKLWPWPEKKDGR